jgi:outer membrane usher protein
MMSHPDGRAVRARRRQAGRLAIGILALAVAAFAGTAAAQPPSLLAALGATGPEVVVAQITLNEQKKGQFFVTVIDGRFLARTEDLKAIGLTSVRGRTRTSGGEEYVWVDSIAGVQATFDEARLSLDLVVDPRLLPETTIDLWSGRGSRVIYPDNASAFFNYDIAYSGGNSGAPDGFSTTTQIGARVGDFLFLSDSTCSAVPGDRGCVRLTTSLVHDRRDTLVRTIVGDFGFASGYLGTTFSMGGLSYSKLYDIDPYFIRYPQQSLTGQLRTPSEVDVYIDGQRVRTLRLPAGDFDLRNITQATGYRSVDLVIRDAFGREQRVSTSFYSSERSLKAGLQEYSYNLGALRENFGVESNDYGPLAFAGFHRYGVTDALTLGIRAEGKSGRFSGGPTATIVLGAAGLLNVAASVSDDGGRTGGAALVSYSYLGQHFNAGLLARKDSPNYATLIDVGLERRDYEFAGNVGYTAPVWGSFSAGLFAFKPYEGQDRKAASLSYGRPLFGGRASFFVTVVNEWAADRRTNVFAGFSYNFDADYSLTGYYQRLRNGTSESIQFQKAQPVGEGLGYVVGVSRLDTPEGSNTQFAPSFQYNGRWATLRGYAQQGDGEGSPRSYSLAVAGGIAWAGGMVAAGRPVTDSFGVVKVDELEGVRVSVNNEEIGRTGANGRLFVPSLASFLDNQVSIDVKGMPLDYTFPESTLVVSPAYRAGAVVNFQARRLQAFVGTLQLRANGKARPAEFFQVTLDVDGRPVTFVTGRGGEFYVEDLKSGRYKAEMSANGTRCRFELVVTEATGPFTELGETICEMSDEPAVPMASRVR